MGSRRFFLGVSAIVFVASAALTIAASRSMSAMGAMEMPGGWTMSHMWMRMPGQSWSSATVSFVGMWVVMMIAMMLPSLTPALLCYREAVGRTGSVRPGLVTAFVGVGYFAVWTAFGAMVFSFGALVADATMRQPALSHVVPTVATVVVLAAGLLQLTAWKARHLASCRQASARHLTPPGGAGAAVQHGLRLGVHCSAACAGLTVVAFALGIMDLRVMAALTVAITTERLAPNGARVASVTGVIAVVAGPLTIA